MNYIKFIKVFFFVSFFFCSKKKMLKICFFPMPLASLSFSGKQQFKTPAEQHQAITQMVEQCFALVDDNKDGVLQFEE